MALDVLNPILQGLQGRSQIGQMQRQAQQQQQMKQQQQMMGDIGKTLQSGGELSSSTGFSQLQSTDPEKAFRIQQQSFKSELDKMNLSKGRKDAMFEDYAMASGLLKSDPQSGINLLNRRIDLINGAGGDPSDTVRILEIAQQNPGQASLMLGKSAELYNSLSKKANAPAEVQSFNDLVEKAGLSKAGVQEAAKIHLGLTSRAIGSADMTLAQNDELKKLVKDMLVEKAQATKFAEMTGASRSKAIDDGFAKVQNITESIKNYDKAIDLIDRGAGSGKIESLLPSMKASTIELDNLKNQLGLDVISSVSFGALSEGELKLALDTALPKLDDPDLKNWLIKKKNSQEKLMGYFENQIQFLENGGTKAGFLRKMKKDGANKNQDPNEFQGFKVVR